MTYDGQARVHSDAYIEVSETGMIHQTPAHFTALAISHKLSGTEWAVWGYLCMKFPFADFTKQGKKVYKELPTLDDIGLDIGRSGKAVARAMKVIEELGFYSFQYEYRKGFNETALAAKQTLKNRGQLESELNSSEEQGQENKKDARTKQFSVELNSSEQGVKSSHIKPSSFAQTVSDFLSHSLEEDGGLKNENKFGIFEMVGTGESSLYHPKFVPGQTFDFSQDYEACYPDEFDSYLIDAPSCLELAGWCPDKDSAPPHVTIPRVTSYLSRSGKSPCELKEAQNVQSHPFWFGELLAAIEPHVSESFGTALPSIRQTRRLNEEVGIEYPDWFWQEVEELGNSGRLHPMSDFYNTIETGKKYSSLGNSCYGLTCSNSDFNPALDYIWTDNKDQPIVCVSFRGELFLVKVECLIEE